MGIELFSSPTKTHARRFSVPSLPSSSAHRGLSLTTSTSTSTVGGSGRRSIWLPATLLVLFCIGLLTLHTDAPIVAAEVSASFAQSAQDRYDSFRVKIGQQLPYRGSQATPGQLQAIQDLEPEWRWAANTSIVYTVSPAN